MGFDLPRLGFTMASGSESFRVLELFKLRVEGSV